MRHLSELLKWLYYGLVLVILGFGIEPREVLGDDRDTNPGIRRNTLEVVPYQGLEYRFKIIGPNEAAPSGFEQPDFNDTEFAAGSAAFGSGGDCPLQSSVLTEWPVESQLLVRRELNIPEGTNGARIMVSADNDIVGVFFNGALIASNIKHHGCPILDEFRINVPQTLLQAGRNVVAFHVRDRGNESFFDARVLAEITQEELGDAAAPPPIEPIALTEVLCAVGEPQPLPGNDFIPTDITIAFKVQANGDVGVIRISNPAPGEFTREDLLNEEIAQTCTKNQERTQCVGNNDPDLNPKSLRAFGQVAAHPQVASEIFNCYGRLPTAAAPLHGGPPPVRRGCASRAALVKTGCVALAAPWYIVSLLLSAIEENLGADICTEAADNEFEKCMSGN